MNWQQAFARQAISDLDAREALLAQKTLPICHSLHYVQMACEKLCKASLIAGGADPTKIQRSHAHIAAQLPNIVKLYMNREARRLPRENWIVRAIRPLARKIELLNPAVDDAGRSPQNCEYPWELSNGEVIAPADFDFDFSELFERAGTAMLKVIRRAAEELQG